ncbi:MAG: FecR domain-containing protein [Rhodocyclaceae bacterium]|nr:FecR domain-containing protein [Rhodocyclaceae bacterium]
MKSAAASAVISSEALDEAADWLLRLRDGEADRQSFEQWRSSSPEHARAWARAEMLLGKIAAVPPALALPALDRPTRGGRRAALAKIGKLALLLGLLPAGWTAWSLMERQGLFAEYRTAAGERRELRLADGTRLTLNTATAVDVRFSPDSRLILLRTGEILVATGHDDAAGRPLQVLTRHGAATPLGTRFTVRQGDGGTHVAVFEGRVRIAPMRASDAARVLESGQRATYGESAVTPPQATDDSASAWAHGMLLADDMPLSELAAELSRYRPGLIHCAGDVADWRVSGAFPVGDAAAIDRSLAMLAATHPLDIRRRLSGLWVTLGARR